MGTTKPPSKGDKGARGFFGHTEDRMLGSRLRAALGTRFVAHILASAPAQPPTVVSGHVVCYLCGATGRDYRKRWTYLPDGKVVCAAVATCRRNREPATQVTIALDGGLCSGCSEPLITGGLAIHLVVFPDGEYTDAYLCERCINGETARA